MANLSSIDVFLDLRLFSDDTTFKGFFVFSFASSMYFLAVA